MFEGLFQSTHLLLVAFLIVLGVVGVFGFVILRLLWKAGTRLGESSDTKK